MRCSKVGTMFCSKVGATCARSQVGTVRCTTVVPACARSKVGTVCAIHSKVGAVTPREEWFYSFDCKAQVYIVVWA